MIPGLERFLPGSRRAQGGGFPGPTPARWGGTALTVASFCAFSGRFADSHELSELGEPGSGGGGMGWGVGAGGPRRASQRGNLPKPQPPAPREVVLCSDRLAQRSGIPSPGPAVSP